MEDDIEHPVQPVFDPPVGSYGMREGLGFELCRRKIVAPLALASASALDAGLDHADHGQMGKARFISEAPIREQPSDVVADQMAALFDPAMISVSGDVDLFDHLRWRIVKEGHDIVMCCGTVALESQQMVPAAPRDDIGDGCLGSHGVDRDQCTGEFQPLEQQGYGIDLIGLVANSFLPEHEPLPARPGGNQMQRLDAFSPRMAAARGLAIHRDDVWLALAQGVDPEREAGLEQFPIQCIDGIVERIM